MTNYEKKQNEIFFKTLIRKTKEGGFWLWPETMHLFKKRGSKFIAPNYEALEDVRSIVDKNAGINLFSI